MAALACCAIWPTWNGPDAAPMPYSGKGPGSVSTPGHESALALKRRARRINRILGETYPYAVPELDFGDPFELVVATVLSAQTTDVRVNATTPALFARYPDAFALAEADLEAERELVRRFREISATAHVALAFDRFEEAGTLDEWLRERLLPELPANLLIVIAGRYPLGGPWLSAGWRHLTIRLPLGELEYADVREYANRIGLDSESEWTDELWIQSAGYPLSLSLYAQLAVARQSAGTKTLKFTGDRDKLDTLLRLWLDEAPEDDIRPQLNAAAIPR